MAQGWRVCGVPRAGRGLAWLVLVAVGACAESSGLPGPAPEAHGTPGAGSPPPLVYDVPVTFEPGPRGLVAPEDPRPWPTAPPCADPRHCPHGFSCAPEAPSVCAADPGTLPIRVDIPRDLWTVPDGVGVTLHVRRNGAAPGADARGRLDLWRLGPRPGRFFADLEPPFDVGHTALLPPGRYHLTLALWREDEVGASPVQGTLTVRGSGEAVLDQRVRRVLPRVRLDGEPAPPPPAGVYFYALDDAGARVGGALDAGVAALGPGRHRLDVSSFHRDGEWPVGWTRSVVEVAEGEGVQEIEVDLPTRRRSFRITVDGEPLPEAWWSPTNPDGHDLFGLRLPLASPGAVLEGWFLGEPVGLSLHVRSDLGRIHLTPGELGHMDDARFDLETVAIPVTVTADGEPLVCDVHAVEVGHPHRRVHARFDAPGRYTLALPRGRAYRVIARSGYEVVGTWLHPEVVDPDHADPLVLETRTVEQRFVVDDVLDEPILRHRVELLRTDDPMSRDVGAELPRGSREGVFRVAEGEYDLSVRVDSLVGEGRRYGSGPLRRVRITADDAAPILLDPFPARFEIEVTWGGTALAPAAEGRHHGLLFLDTAFGSPFRVPLPGPRVEGRGPLWIGIRWACVPDEGCDLPAGGAWLSNASVRLPLAAP